MKTCNVFGPVLCGILIVSASSVVVLGQNNQAADHSIAVSGGDSLPPPSETAVGQSSPGDDPRACCQPCFCPRWTASAEFIGLDRTGGVSQTLVSTYPPHNPIILGTGTEKLNSRDLTQGFAGGPRLDLIRHGDDGCNLELSFFEIDGWSNMSAIEPDGGMLPNWLVFAAPGDFVQTTDYPTQPMVWAYTTRLYSAELNVRWDLGPRVTMLAGFRWVNLGENLQGTLPPRPEPFWNTNARNNLYGFQLGEQWRILNRGRFSIDGLIKAGVFDNDAEETTGISIYRQLYWESASTNRAAFLGETSVQCKYQISQRLLLKVGYEAIWLQNLALAPAQIHDAFSNGTPITDVYVQALGIDSKSGVFLQGVTAGLEYAF